MRSTKRKLEEKIPNDLPGRIRGILPPREPVAGHMTAKDIAGVLNVKIAYVNKVLYDNLLKRNIATSDEITTGRVKIEKGMRVKWYSAHATDTSQCNGGGGGGGGGDGTAFKPKFKMSADVRKAFVPSMSPQHLSEHHLRSSCGSDGDCGSAHTVVATDTLGDADAVYRRPPAPPDCHVPPPPPANNLIYLSESLRRAADAISTCIGPQTSLHPHHYSGFQPHHNPHAIRQLDGVGGGSGSGSALSPSFSAWDYSGSDSDASCNGGKGGAPPPHLPQNSVSGIGSAGAVERSIHADPAIIEMCNYPRYRVAPEAPPTFPSGWLVRIYVDCDTVHEFGQLGSLRRSYVNNVTLLGVQSATATLHQEGARLPELACPDMALMQCKHMYKEAGQFYLWKQMTIDSYEERMIPQDHRSVFVVVSGEDVTNNCVQLLEQDGFRAKRFYNTDNIVQNISDILRISLTLTSSG